MIRILPATLLFSTVLFTATAAPPAERNQLDGNESLFTVMAAMNAAGFDVDIKSTANSPVRKAVRDYLKQKNLPVMDELRKFFIAHKQKTETAEFNQYVSFALCVKGAPDFTYRYKPSDLPPEVLPLEGLSDIMNRFYQEAEVHDMWLKSQPFIDRMIADYQAPLSQGILQVNAWLRNPTSGAPGRHFEVIFDPLGPPNQVQTRSFLDDYFMIVTASQEPQVDQVRHGYMHYLLDPLVLRTAEPLAKKRALVDYATGAPALDDSYKDDFFLLATECLVKSVEIRLSPGKRVDQVNQALSEGFIYTGAFFDGFPAYEKQEQAFRYFFKDLVDAIDLRSEVKRLDGVKFARYRSERIIKSAAVEPEAAPATGVFKTYERAQTLYSERKLPEAREAYLEILKSPDQQSIHSKAYYGLARIAVLQNEGELADRMFQKTLEIGPDDETKAWALVYLGRLADARGEREQAVGHYKSALAVPGATPGARAAAEQGFKKSFSNQK